jgi:regulatory protein
VNIGHRGRLRIRAELAKRGVERAHIDSALKEAPDEVAAAREVADKYRSRNRRLEPAILRRRLYGFLARRGFTPDTISRVIGGSEE